MKKTIFLLLLSLSSLLLFAAGGSDLSGEQNIYTIPTGRDRSVLLDELDRKINLRHAFMQRKEHRIDSLRSLLTPDMPLGKRFAVNHLIYEEYSTYRCDSAMRYVFYNRDIADQLGNPTFRDKTAIALSMLLSTTGMYRESLENLNYIERSHLDEELLTDYYSVAEWAYYAASQYTNDSLYAPRYMRMESLYRDSVFLTLTPGTERFDYYRGKILLHEGRLEDALDIFLSTYPHVPADTRLYAIITFDIATIYQRFGNMDKYEEFLIFATMSDQMNPLKENLAGQELALYLFRNKPEDLDRAYRYIQCSMDDARFYNNRLRIVQISEKMPVIVEAYQKKSESEKTKLLTALLTISALSLFCILVLFYLYKQIRLVRKSRQELRQLIGELNLLNSKLHDSNHVREEYVGVFIDLCSSYIDKLDKYREMVKRKVTANQFDDLYKTVSSTRAIEAEQNDFLQNFDRSFLKLFPTFIEDFNSLLLPEEKIYPRKNEVLNRELRIFALIRLGIKDSARIASFLRYSPQTVYNNRTRVKGKAVDRENFERMVMGIGDLYSTNSSGKVHSQTDA